MRTQEGGGGEGEGEEKGKRTLADQILGQVGGQHVGRQGGGHAGGEGGQRGEHARGDQQAVLQGRHVRQQRLHALLQVLVVRRRRALDAHHQAGHLPEGAARFAAQELKRVGCGASADGSL